MAEEFKKSPARDTLESLIVTVILAVFGTTFVVQAFKIPTGSMEESLDSTAILARLPASRATDLISIMPS